MYLVFQLDSQTIILSNAIRVSIVLRLTHNLCESSSFDL